MKATMKPLQTKLPDIPEAEQTPLVKQLLEIIHRQAEELQHLRDEIARLKRHKTKPKIRPSQLENSSKKQAAEGKRPGSEKRSKTAQLEIHETCRIPPKSIPPGSTFKDCQAYIVQEIEIAPHNMRYLLERWETPAGGLLVGQLPDAVQDRHFGPTLVSYILYQYYQCHVTQPLLLEALREWGIDVSSGQLNRILTEDKERFHDEKQELLSVALRFSPYVNVDDTGARHQGKNGYCTHIGNEFFAWFESTRSKSRLNFLQLLRTGPQDYVLNEEAFDYMRARGCPQYLLTRLGEHAQKTFSDSSLWEAHLRALQIQQPRHLQMATEGALLGSILTHGLPQSLGIVSDDAGQFNIFDHALCWIHAERTLNKIIPSNDKEREALQEIREQLWQLYNDLKAYKAAPTEAEKQALAVRFDTLFTTKTCDATLNLALKRLHANKSELLRVLERPEIPLHNNLSEQDIREYVKRRKISGSTRSELGRQARDTFTSLKKTCRKLGVSFWKYLKDRTGQLHQIPPLSELIQQRALAPD